MLFNVNERVRVRLTKRGHAILRQDYEELHARAPSLGPFSPPLADAEGWVEFQLWEAMSIFGPHITMGLPVPFETTIDIPFPAENNASSPSEASASALATDTK